MSVLLVFMYMKKLFVFIVAILFASCSKSHRNESNNVEVCFGLFKEARYIEKQISVLNWENSDRAEVLKVRLEKIEAEVESLEKNMSAEEKEDFFCRLENLGEKEILESVIKLHMEEKVLYCVELYEEYRILENSLDSIDWNDKEYDRVLGKLERIQNRIDEVLYEIDVLVDSMNDQEKEELYENLEKKGL